MDLSQHFATIWARRYPLLLAALVGTAAVFAFRSIATPTYSATATLQARPAGEASAEAGAAAARTAAAFATSRGVVDAAVAEDVPRVDPTAAQAQVTTQIREAPGFFLLTARASSPDEAAALANAVVRSLQRRLSQEAAVAEAAAQGASRVQLAEIRSQLSRLEPGDPARADLERREAAALEALDSGPARAVPEVSVVDPALPGGLETRPRRDALFAFLVILILGAEAVALRHAWRGGLSERDPAEHVSEVIGAPAVEVGPDAGPYPPAVTAVVPALRSRRLVIALQRGGRPSGRGAADLARALSVTGAQVLLVDATPEGAVLHTELGIPATPGLADVLRGQTPLAMAVTEVPQLPGAMVLPAGDLGAQAAALFAGDGLNRMIDELAHLHVVLHVSAGSIGQITPLLARYGDAVVLAVDTRSVTARSLKADMSLLNGVSAVVRAALVYRPGRTRMGLRARTGRASLPVASLDHTPGATDSARR